MNLHEYQAKKLFAEYGISVPLGEPVDSPKAARQAAERLGGKRWVVKAQVHAGGRAKGGGIKLVDNPAAVEEAANGMLGKRLKTPQTRPEGLPVETVLVEEATEFERELYLGLLVDRTRQQVAIMASAAGGMDIEEVAVRTPERILTVSVHPAAGLQPYQVRRLAFGLGLDQDQRRDFGLITGALYRLFVDKDLSLVEINPLIVRKDGSLTALDAKINVEDNALFRQKSLSEMRDPSQEDEVEREASEHGLSYVSLEGNIACMVNGAGLAMATMDVIKLHGGEPANFLDVGGGATSERVTEAFKLILANDKVKAILVNIFGGIVRCDLIAEGIVAAVKQIGVTVPVVVRLEGTNVDKGRALLDRSGLDIVTAEDLSDAARKIVSLAA